MNSIHKLESVREEMSHELVDRILPFWRERTIDLDYGGFVGRMTQSGQIDPDAPKGAVLNARILWTFAAAARLLGNPSDLELASRAHRYVRNHFWDPEFGGVFWTVDKSGKSLETTKKVYAQAFVIYGLSERYLATADSQALDEAIQLFELVEEHARDDIHGGYFESFGRAWDEIEDVRLGMDDDNAPKSMNTQLHVLEAYTNLLRCWPSEILRERLVALLRIHLDYIIDPVRDHMRLFFESDWTPRSTHFSYGHDIEACWLLLDAANVVDDESLLATVRSASIRLARSTMTRGQDQDGGVFWLGDTSGPVDCDKHWWPQAEAVVGFERAYDLTGDESFAESAWKAWQFTKEHILDVQGGEWLGRLSRDRVPYGDEDKVGLWKCPYHNARACLEIGFRERSKSRLTS